MRKIVPVVIFTFMVIMHPYHSIADPASEAYRAALTHGNKNEIYRAQSYLAPTFCYDLNTLHGVTFTRTINGNADKPSYPFIYQDMTHLKVRKLYTRAGIDKMIASSHTEFELIQRICNWANMHFGHMLPLPYAAWDAHEILDRVEKGDAFFCTYKAALFVQACNAAGITARILGINPKHKAAHTVTEVYSNEYRTWVVVDPWLNCYFERDGKPLSALDLHNSIDNPEGIYLVFGENGRGLEYWSYKTGKAKTIPHANARTPIMEDPSKGLYEFYYDIRIVMRNDHTVHPQFKDNVYVDGFIVPYNPRGGEWWGPQLKWSDDRTPPQITCWNTGKFHDFEWTLNEVEVDLKKLTVPGEPVIIEAKFSTFTPCFSHYHLEIDGKVVPVNGDVYVWKFKKGGNSLKIASVNAVGRKGFPSEFVLEYNPDSVAPPERTAVELKNANMEKIDEKSTKRDCKPAHWSTITSNPLSFGEFNLDSKIKHTGKYALKATPVRDPETGVEYAFIVMSESFTVNPATDVIYSIWLRASKNNSPVDIVFHDTATWGLGIYVKRVVVNNSWKKYELKCRLHNKLTKAFAGFKVYTGTVWADDAQYEEVN